MAINADISLSYSLDPTKVPAFYVKFLSAKLDDFTNGFFHSVTRDCLNENAGKYEIDQLMGDNAEFLKTSRDCIDSRVSQYGVHLEQFGIIGAPRPPEAVIQNINAKIQASQLGLQKQMELQQVQADVAKQIAAAEGNAKAQIASANGEAEANRIRNASTTPTILQLKTLENQRAMIDKWNGTSPTTVLQSDGKSVILQLPKE
jgi:regulator of protease activity HflC (stomatin/prohibitin superfamily)